MGEQIVQTIFTIGYEGTDIDRFVATLVEVGIELLVDVRAVTVSRKKGFSKNGLRARLEAEGIQYVHLRGLGDRSRAEMQRGRPIRRVPLDLHSPSRYRRSS